MLDSSNAGQVLKDTRRTLPEVTSTCFLCDVAVRKPRCKGERHLLQKCVRKQRGSGALEQSFFFCREAQVPAVLAPDATSPCSVLWGVQAL